MQRYINSIRSSTTWWVVLLQGILAIVIGILILLGPFKFAIFMVRLLGAYLFVSGLLQFFNMFRRKEYPGPEILLASTGLLAGLLIMLFQLWSVVLLPPIALLIGAVLGIAYGIMQIIQGFTGEGIDNVGVGLLSTVIGLILLTLIVPVGALFSVSLAVLLLATPLIVAICGIVIGVFLIVRALRMHREPAISERPPVMEAVQEWSE
ncbi:hypothetical protein KDA_60110 [Dictyobacter alpinus]|uniref:DUF308 domain-containing protein n=1 Tax=Dictyobacter alpinus TaxID=2014873 RepID=A0A402BH08_9CHLR|nr:DUF308 domain-containing protein [Dictyobacter alpinus]GCE30527.1 hypothetical protein KDA_60110 [Dictyobacter alpinus]